MKQPKTYLLFLIFGIGIGLFLINQTSCRQEHEKGSKAEDPAFSETELIALRTNEAPVLDGKIDRVWNNAQKLVGKAIVPDPGDDLFKGYVNNTYDFTMRALYDAGHIYFLIEWRDSSMDLSRQTWYFDPGPKKWMQESRYPVFDTNGLKIRDAFYEDKLAFLWNVGGSVSEWNHTTCLASCHTGLGAENGFARHFTNAPGERIDMWHWKSVRNGLINGQADDQFQDETQPNGRKSDSRVSGGYTDNIQELVVQGDTIQFPKYFIPNRMNYYWISREEIDAGVAKQITSADENGVLYYEGGSLDPNLNTGFQRNGGRVGAKGIPSVYLEKWTGNRGDLLVSARHTGSGWIMELQRQLKTNDSEKQDVDFSSLEDQAFGISIFDNAALAHAICANLRLKFEKETGMR